MVTPTLDPWGMMLTEPLAHYTRRYQFPRRILIWAVSWDQVLGFAIYTDHGKRTLVNVIFKSPIPLGEINKAFSKTCDVIPAKETFVLHVTKEYHKWDSPVQDPYSSFSFPKDAFLARAEFWQPESFTE